VRKRRAGAELRRVARDGLQALNETLGIRKYQPLYGLTDEDRARFPESQRPVAERWDHIAAHLPPAGSAMDIGSQHGWFTFKLAEHGLHAIGVEKSLPALRLAQWLTVYNQTDRACFLRADVTPESVRALPRVDVVICMAVFHHWVRLQGFDAAAQIMQGLADRCRDRMFFETGQVGDTDSADRDSLAFMGESPRQWIEDFLLSLGFAKVTHLGELTRMVGSPHTRHLMLATK
jgi:hypothetical protein